MLSEGGGGGEETQVKKCSIINKKFKKAFSKGGHCPPQTPPLNTLL